MKVGPFESIKKLSKKVSQCRKKLKRGLTYSYRGIRLVEQTEQKIRRIRVCLEENILK